MIVFREDDPPFGGARLKEKRPAMKAFGSTRSSDVASEQRLAEIAPPVARLKENLHRASLIAECRKFGKVRRWVFRVSTGMQIKRCEAF